MAASRRRVPARSGCACSIGSSPTATSNSDAQYAAAFSGMPLRGPSPATGRKRTRAAGGSGTPRSMTDVAFYHLQKSPLEAVLPKLLEKTLAAGKRALVLASSAERVEALAAHLWTYDPDSWLPHGTAQDGSPEEQPIWLTEKEDNLNGAAFLFLTDGADSSRVA